jgi:hypothetical protein
MLEAERWTIAERYMVRHHLSRLVWIALTVVSLLVVMLGVLLAITSIDMLSPSPSARTHWFIAFLVTPVLTGAGFLVKDAFLGRVQTDWELYRFVIHYKRTVLYTYLLTSLAGAVPIAVAAWSGQFSYPLIITIVPLVAMLIHFPHIERFNVYIEDILHAPSM